MIDNNLDGSGERLKQIRTVLGKTQMEFAEIIKTSHGHISGMEKDKKNITESTIELLKEKFNVNEHWLRTGEGGNDNIFTKQSDDAIEIFANKYQLTDAEKSLISGYVKLNKEHREMFQVYLKNILNVQDKALTDSEFSEDNDIEAELADYKKELEAEKKGQSACVDIKETKVAKAK